MNEAKFWRLMDEARAESNGDVEEQMRILAKKLEKLPVSEIIEYQRFIDTLLDQAYSWELWAAGSILNGGCSDDGFYYFRSWLITQGKGVYDNAVRDPEALADLPLPDDELECHTLFEVPWWAYEARTGQEFPLEIRLTWTTSSDGPTGEEWIEEDVGDKYPRLVMKSKHWS